MVERPSFVKKIVSNSFKDVSKFLGNFYGFGLEISELFVKEFQHIKAFKNYYAKKYQSKFSHCRQNNTNILEEYADNKLAKIAISKELSIKNKPDFLALNDYNSLYPAATAHRDSKW